MLTSHYIAYTFKHYTVWVGALLGLGAVVDFIVELHGLLAGQETLAETGPLLPLGGVLLLILSHQNLVM